MKAPLATPTAGSPAARHAASAAPHRLTSVIGNRAMRAAVTGTTAPIQPRLSPAAVVQLKSSIGRAPGGPKSHPARSLARPHGDAAVHASVAPGVATPWSNTNDMVGERENRTGLPEGLKAGMEALSGISLDDVRVHYHSPSPAELGARAYTRGTEIHLAPGAEKHLAHEAWHVVQQKEGRVRPTMQVEGAAVNDDAGLEGEADAMGARSLEVARGGRLPASPVGGARSVAAVAGPAVTQGYDLSYGALLNDCGTDAHVLISGKNDPDLGKGSQPSVVPNWWPRGNNAVAQYFKSYVVQGHLLNEELGGPGNTMDNLTPITRSSNTTHFTRIENEVKKEVLQNDMWVEYRVRADYSTHPNLADLGNNPPPGVAPYLQYMAGTIGADYDVYDPKTKNKVRGRTGELLIKNEGPQKKGTFV